MPQSLLIVGKWRCRTQSCDRVLAWGCKPSARRCQRFAARRGLPLSRLEDAFLRSISPNNDPPLGLVLDDHGIFYDSSSPSRLEQLISCSRSPVEELRANALIASWRAQRVSKYNGSREAPIPRAAFVLVVDQTAGDLSITYGEASAASFEAMLAAALKHHPHCRVVVKTHPEVALGLKSGHFRATQLNHPRIQLESSGGHPTALLEHAEAVYVVTSQLGFEALLWNKPVYCFGMPFYAGWGLTHDTLPAPERRSRAAPRQITDLVHAALVDYAVYINPHTHQRCEVEDLIKAIGLQRHYISKDPTVANAIGFTRWKRPFLKRFMPVSSFRFGQPSSSRDKVKIVHWGRRCDQDSDGHPDQPIQVEDGFLRSVGLGNPLHLLLVRWLNTVGIRAARPAAPLSWVVDHQGIHYDATRPSDLESWLAHAELSADQLDRAAALRERLLREGITKYNLSAPGWQRPPGLKRVVLVPGQVESDASIRYGAVDIHTNLELLQAVRRAEPDAFLIYKPHPDVVAGLRRASAAECQAQGVADLVLRDAAMEQLFTQVDAVHVLTSLAGFEALLRGLEVHTWGLPFYAGWGLTQDAHPCPRRGRQLSLDALVYGALIAYPRYVSRRSGWLITPEEAIDELVAWRQQTSGRLTWRSRVVRLWARLRRSR